MSIEQTIAQAVAEELRVELDALREAVHNAAVEPAPALLTAAELARHLRVSRSTVQRLASDGCPRVYVIDSPRYRLEDVLAWLRERAS